MGVDLLDVRLGLERRMGVEIPESEFLSRLRSHSERVEAEAAAGDESGCVLTVGQFFDIIVAAIQSRGGTIPPDTRAKYVSAIADIADVEPEEIHADDCLIRDLGF